MVSDMIIYRYIFILTLILCFGCSDNVEVTVPINGQHNVGVFPTISITYKIPPEVVDKKSITLFKIDNGERHEIPVTVKYDYNKGLAELIPNDLLKENSEYRVFIQSSVLFPSTLFASNTNPHKFSFFTSEYTRQNKHSSLLHLGGGLQGRRLVAQAYRGCGWCSGHQNSLDGSEHSESSVSSSSNPFLNSAVLTTPGSLPNSQASSGSATGATIGGMIGGAIGAVTGIGLSAPCAGTCALVMSPPMAAAGSALGVSVGNNALSYLFSLGHDPLLPYLSPSDISHVNQTNQTESNLLNPLVNELTPLQGALNLANSVLTGTHVMPADEVQELAHDILGLIANVTPAFNTYPHIEVLKSELRRVHFMLIVAFLTPSQRPLYTAIIHELFDSRDNHFTPQQVYEALIGRNRLIILGNNTIEDLTLLSGFHHLTDILLYDTIIQDLSPLAYISSLTVLSIESSASLVDLSSLLPLRNLQILKIDSMGAIRSLRPLDHLPRLQKYNIVSTFVGMHPRAQLLAPSMYIRQEHNGRQRMRFFNF